MRKFVMTAAVACSMLTASGAQAAEASCVTVDEAHGLVIAVLPDVIGGIAKKCESVLPEAATLRGGLSSLMARYRPASETAWPMAGPVIAKLAGKDMASVDPKIVRPLIAPMLADMVAKDIKPQDCPKVDRIVGALAPLPPTNIADLFVAVLEMSGDKKDAPKICPASGRQ